MDDGPYLVQRDNISKEFIGEVFIANYDSESPESSIDRRKGTEVEKHISKGLE